MSSLPDHFTNSPLPWLNSTSDCDSIVLSCEASLSRNLQGIPFPNKASATQLLKGQQKVQNALMKLEPPLFPYSFALADLRDLDRDLLSERRLLPANFESFSNDQSYLYCSNDESISCLTNSEDHFKVSISGKDNCLNEISQKVQQLDFQIQQHIQWAHSPKFGYLTASPLLVGSGFRVSVLVNLVGLELNGQLNKTVTACNRLGWNINSLMNDNERFPGNIYQISNQRTLGYTPEQTTRSLQELLSQISSQENNQRKALAFRSPEKILDYIGRPYGRLLYSHLAFPAETLHELLLLRTGVQLKVLQNLDIDDINQLITDTMNAHLNYHQLGTHAELAIEQVRSQKIQALIAE